MERKEIRKGKRWEGGMERKEIRKGKRWEGGMEKDVERGIKHRVRREGEEGREGGVEGGWSGKRRNKA